MIQCVRFTSPKAQNLLFQFSMERYIQEIFRIAGRWVKMEPMENSPSFVLGKWFVVALLLINGLRNSFLRPAYVLGKTHFWVRINRRNGNCQRNTFKGKDRRGSCDKAFPKYIRASLYNIAVAIIGLLCFVEGTVKFCKQA
jgi:hypothetical protein